MSPQEGARTHFITFVHKQDLHPRNVFHSAARLCGAGISVSIMEDGSKRSFFTTESLQSRQAYYELYRDFLTTPLGKLMERASMAITHPPSLTALNNTIASLEQGNFSDPTGVMNEAMTYSVLATLLHEVLREFNGRRATVPPLAHATPDDFAENNILNAFNEDSLIESINALKEKGIRPLTKDEYEVLVARTVQSLKSKH